MHFEFVGNVQTDTFTSSCLLNSTILNFRTLERKNENRFGFKGEDTFWIFGILPSACFFVFVHLCVDMLKVIVLKQRRLSDLNNPSTHSLTFRLQLEVYSQPFIYCQINVAYIQFDLFI